MVLFLVLVIAAILLAAIFRDFIKFAKEVNDWNDLILYFKSYKLGLKILWNKRRLFYNKKEKQNLKDINDLLFLCNTLLDYDAELIYDALECTSAYSNPFIQNIVDYVYNDCFGDTPYKEMKDPAIQLLIDILEYEKFKNPFYDFEKDYHFFHRLLSQENKL